MDIEVVVPDDWTIGQTFAVQQDCSQSAGNSSTDTDVTDLFTSP
jgi:hypothetical protein